MRRADVLLCWMLVAVSGCDGDLTVARPDAEVPPMPAAAVRPMSRDGAPSARTEHALFWTGTEALVWGGQTWRGQGILSLETGGGRYDPRTNTWRKIPTLGGPGVRSYPAVVFTGRELIVWSGAPSVGGPGFSDDPVASGARYDVANDTWTPMSASGGLALLCTYGGAVWSGSEMIIWAGDVTSGGRAYDPSTDRWRTISNVGEPSRRRVYTSTFVSDQVVVWGGNTLNNDAALGDGARYDPSTDTWKPVSLVGAPSPRYLHGAIAVGERLLVLGGSLYANSQISAFADGGLYDPRTDTWSVLPASPHFSARQYQSMVWTGTRVLVWGGAPYGFDPPYNDGVVFDPATRSFTPLEPSLPLAPRILHAATWTGSEMIVFGGGNLSTSEMFGDGVVYRP